MREFIAILDFGAQYGQLIARRVREARVFCEIVPHTVTASELAARAPRGLILTGGPASVYEPGAPDLDPALFELGIPILGICYGMQLMTARLGGRVRRAERREFGPAELVRQGDDPILTGLPDRFRVWMSHGDAVEAIPPGFTVLGQTENTPYAFVADRARRFYGVQFHPEVVHTERGREILENFLHRVCGCRGDWTMAALSEEAIGRIREEVGEGRVVCALSGGVDSTVAATLVHRALGDRLTCIFVDHGLLREGEAAEVRELLGGLGLNLRYVDASERFLQRLAGVTDPEEKRKTVGRLFIEVFTEEARALGPIGWLVQGTLYPDVIESGGGAAHTIKSHHNVGGLPEHLPFRLLEPLRWLFKDEVRRLGLELGLPETVVWRQPFPGPGLAVRIVGEVTRERLALVRRADAIVREEVGRAGLDREVWQYFAVLTSTRSVGVTGDRRSYGYTVAVRAVTSQDGMTADWARLPYDLLDRIGSRIANEIPEVNRVVYDVSAKPPATIEWE